MTLKLFAQYAVLIFCILNIGVPLVEIFRMNTVEGTRDKFVNLMGSIFYAVAIWLAGGLPFCTL